MDSLTISSKNTGRDFSYDIVWTDTFRGLADAVSGIPAVPGKICIVTDSNVSPLYLDSVISELRTLFPGVYHYVIPAGEENKNIETIIGIYDYLIANKFDRTDMLAALGGGVTGDMTGFAAATYLRGIDYIQIPTTLLSQVDSSVGGKTGIDFDNYKNMIGAFYQPRLVYMNMDTLKTLPDDQFASGMAEILKSAYIRDAEFALWLQKNRQNVSSRDPDTLAHIIRKCCEIKACVVSDDPGETGLRAILNFGHTLGHAVEKLKNFTMLHGHCVAAGMAAAGYLSVKRGYISEEEYQFILEMNRNFGLPVNVSSLTPRDILEAAKSDKKMKNGRINFILLHPFGNAVIDSSVSEDDILEMAEVICGRER